VPFLPTSSDQYIPLPHFPPLYLLFVDDASEIISGL